MSVCFEGEGGLVGWAGSDVYCGFGGWLNGDCWFVL